MGFKQYDPPKGLQLSVSIISTWFVLILPQEWLLAKIIPCCHLSSLRLTSVTQQATNRLILVAWMKFLVAQGKLASINVKHWTIICHDYLEDDCNLIKVRVRILQNLTRSCKISLRFLPGIDLRWPTTVTAKANHSRRKQIAHGKRKSLTAKENHSRRKQIVHGESKSLTAKANRSRQKKIAHGKRKSLTAKANRSRRKQIAHGESKSFTAEENRSRRKKIAHGKSNFIEL